MAPAAFFSPYAANVADDAIAAGFGPGSERLRGFPGQHVLVRTGQIPALNLSAIGPKLSDWVWRM